LSLDVAIIGAGPVGLTLANLLGRRVLRVALFEKQAKPYPYPRAIHFDGEVMRIFQATGLADQILKHTHPGKGMLFKDTNDNVVLDWSRDQTIGPMGWLESYRFYQPGLEQVLRDGLARFDHVTLHYGADVTSIDRNTLRLADGAKLNAKFIVACDGTQSTTTLAGCRCSTDPPPPGPWRSLDPVLRPRHAKHLCARCRQLAPMGDAAYR